MILLPSLTLELSGLETTVRWTSSIVPVLSRQWDPGPEVGSDTDYNLWPLVFDRGVGVRDLVRREVR